MGLSVPWRKYYEATDSWPATKAYRQLLFKMLSTEQVMAYKVHGVFKEQQFMVAYGGHYNVWALKGDHYFCTAISNQEPAIEQLIVAQLCVLRTKYTLAAISKLRGKPGGTPFWFCPERISRITGQITFPRRGDSDPLTLHIASDCVGLYDALCNKYPSLT